VGSSTAIAVYDLLSSQLLWVAKGEFTCHATAPRTDWTVGGAWVTSSVVERTSQGKQYAVRLFDLTTGAVRMSETMDSRVVSVEFWRGLETSGVDSDISQPGGDSGLTQDPDMGSASNAGVVALTRLGGLRLLGTAAGLGPLLRSTGFADGAWASHRPEEGLDIAATGAEASNVIGASGIATQGSKGVLSDLFPARNMDLPKLSDVFSTLMWRNMTTHAKRFEQHFSIVLRPDEAAPDAGADANANENDNDNDMTAALLTKAARRTVGGRERGLVEALSVSSSMTAPGTVEQPRDNDGAYEYANFGKAVAFEEALGSLFGSDEFYSSLTHQAKKAKTSSKGRPAGSTAGLKSASTSTTLGKSKTKTTNTKRAAKLSTVTETNGEGSDSDDEDKEEDVEGILPDVRKLFYKKPGRKATPLRTPQAALSLEQGSAVSPVRASRRSKAAEASPSSTPMPTAQKKGKSRGKQDPPPVAETSATLRRSSRSRSNSAMSQ